MTETTGALGFSFRPTKAGDVAIRRGGSLVTLLRGAAARDFVAQVARLPPAGAQQLMARVTGNYKRGNERQAADHPRNRS
jgi:hypothetical protein